MRWIAFIAVVTFFAGCSQPVEVKKVDDKIYSLKSHVPGDAGSFRNSSLSDKADELCPKGFDVISKNIYQTEEIATTNLDCAGGNCAYLMEWRLLCSHKPREPFSIFGKF